MARESSIEWTDATWNPIRGCSLVSDGCRNCYAMRQAHRHSGPGKPYDGLTQMTPTGPKWTGGVRTLPEKLTDPLRWQKPRMVFVNSMSDLFHEQVPDDFVAAIFGVMARAHEHTFQVLTKRPERMQQIVRELTPAEAICAAGIVWPQFFKRPLGGNEAKAIGRRGWPLPNVWLGVSAEDQKTWDERVPYLLKTPAAVRWVSAEPLLDAIVPVVLAVDWLVVGGESGPGHRPIHASWVRYLRDECAAARVPFWFKQWGGRTPKAGGCELDGREHKEWPQVKRT